MSKRPDPSQEKFRRKQDDDKAYRKQLPGEDEEPLPPPTEPIHTQGKPERNGPCPCGSGKKYKQCCGKTAS